MNLSFTFFIVLATFAGKTFQQVVIPSPGPVRGHIRDLIIGAGAPNITCDFLKLVDGEWELIATKVTNAGGSVNTFIHPDNFTYTSYMFKFYSQEYYNALGYDTFYPYLELIFEKQDEEPHLLPITMSPYGYTAYRGRSKPAPAI